MILVLVCVHIRDDPRDGAKDRVCSGCLWKFWVISCSDIVSNRICVADIVDHVADRVDWIFPKLQIISTVHSTKDLYAMSIYAERPLNFMKSSELGERYSVG